MLIQQNLLLNVPKETQPVKPESRDLCDNTFNATGFAKNRNGELRNEGSFMFIDAV